MIICTKYGFDILIISGSYGGHRQHTTNETTPGVWHKLPTDELKNFNYTYPKTICVQYLRILLSSFGEEDF